MTKHDPKACLFCGNPDSFVMTCPHVCLACGDNLQAEYGLMIMSLDTYQAMKIRAEIESSAKE